MLPQFSAIPLQSTEAASDSSRNLNQLLPVGKNVSATVVAVSRDQVQPEIFRLKLEINNRLIQMGVFQALPVGQKINVNRQSDGQIQITPQTTQSTTPQSSDKQANQPLPANTQPPANPQQKVQDANIRLQTAMPLNTSKLPDNGRLLAAVISSRPVYPSAVTITESNTQQPPQTTQQGSATNTSSTTAIANRGNPVTTNTPLQQAATAAPTAQTSPVSPPANIATTERPVINPQTVAQPAAQKANISTAAPSNNTSNQPPNQPQAATAKSGGTPPLNTTSSNPPPSNIAGTPSPPSGAAQTASPTSQPAPVSNNATATPRPETAPTNQNTSNNAGPAVKDSAANTQPPGNPVNTARISAPPTHHAITLALPDGSKVEFNSPQPLPQGAQVLLQKTGTQEALIVKVQLPNLTPNSALDKPAIQEVLRNALPVQIPTGDVFSQLAQTAAVTEGSQASQISSVVRSMLQLFGVRPGSHEAASQIRQNIELGGLHTERFLSEGKTPNPQDMKSQLQQLQNLADRLPDEQRERFEQLLRGLHSRVTSQQLNSLQQWRELPDGGFERVLQFDLPIKQGDRWENLELRLSREGGSNADGEMVSVWRVRLHFDLEELGGVDAEIRLSDEHEISTLFWCDKEGTAEKLRSKADNFAERLRECGFSNSEVQWHQGTAPEQKQAIHKKLVDLHT